MNKFKVGDKVMRDRYEWRGVKPGDICIVKEVKSNGTIMLEGSDAIFDDNCFNLMRVRPDFPELETGMRVVMRNGDKFIVIKDVGLLVQPSNFISLDRYSSDGLFENSEEWDIVQVHEAVLGSHFLLLNILGDILWQEINPEEVARQKRRNEITEEIASLQRELASLAVD